MGRCRDCKKSRPTATRERDFRCDGCKPRIDCPICCEDSSNNPSSVEALVPCGHVFHTDCVTPWFRSGKDTCPQCRTKVDTGGRSGGQEEVEEEVKDEDESEWEEGDEENEEEVEEDLEWQEGDEENEEEEGYEGTVRSIEIRDIQEYRRASREAKSSIRRLLQKARRRRGGLTEQDEEDFDIVQSFVRMMSQ